MMNPFAATQAAMMQQQMMMMQQCAMMQQAAMVKCADTPATVGAASDVAGADTAAGTAASADKMKQAVQHKRKQRQERDEKVTTVFVGGLRKSTSEDKVAAHFAKFGQVDNVDIKRLPDGTSRGFAFVKFMEKDAVEKVVEARSSHMIDNKWVAVRPHGGTEFSKAASAEKDKESAALARSKERDKGTTDDPEANEEDWSERYLSIAAQVGAMQKDAPTDSVSTTQALSLLGNATASPAMAPCNMMNNMGMMAMMNPCMMGMMGGMNPCMMGMMRPVAMMGGCMPGIMPVVGACSSGSEGGPTREEHSASERYNPY